MANRVTDLILAVHQTHALRLARVMFAASGVLAVQLMRRIALHNWWKPGASSSRLFICLRSAVLKANR